MPFKSTKRYIKFFPLENQDSFKSKCSLLSTNTEYFAHFSNNAIEYPFGAFENIIAIDCLDKIELVTTKGAFVKLKDFVSKHQDWIFGFLSYDLKNDIEKLESNNPDSKHFPELCFFIPKHVLRFEDSGVYIESIADPVTLFQEIERLSVPEYSSLPDKIPDFRGDISPSEYKEIVTKLKNHIYEGDFYEINFCMEYSAKIDSFNADFAYRKLWNLSPTPFAVYFKSNTKHLICASPERFIKREKQTIISQPIKGTVASGNSEDEKKKNKEALFNSEKERAENMMIVDLVRNDLSKTAIPGTVKVEEIFGIYEFRHLFQMISTVSSQVSPETNIVDIIKNAFPMGSMTGAPKIMVMETIEKYEKNKRGIFSGSAGYFKPNGDFDFNVIIRSLFYNEQNKSLSYNIGSAITFDSDPESEFYECQLKAKAIREIFGDN